MIFQSIKMAWSAVTSNKMRTFLTMLGIIIGVASLIVLVSIANGATNSVTDQISSMGTNLLTVTITDDKENPLRLSELSTFTDDDKIAEAAPYGQTSVTAKSGYTSDTMTVYGTTGSYLDIQGLELANGRFIKNTDIDNNSYICIVSYDTATELIGRADCVGESISLDGKKFQIVGVLAQDDTDTTTATVSSSSSDDSSSSTVVLEAYIPYTTLTRMADNILYVTTFYASAEDETDMDGAEEALNDLMLARFDNDSDAFSIRNQSSIMEAMESVNSTMALMLGGIAAISLLVGGIGIMNIMLVSVTERTREIGIRKAIGAGRGSILLQFLIEALMVSLMGCAIGIAISWVAIKVAGHFMSSMSMSMSMGVVWISVAFSLFIGVVFGLYPANKASRKKPIEALRHSD